VPTFGTDPACLDLRIFGLRKAHEHLFDVVPSGTFNKANIAAQIELIKRHTYLLDGVKAPVLGLLKQRAARNGLPKPSGGVYKDTFLKMITDDHDAIMFGICCSAIGTKVPWALIGRIRRSLISNLISNRDKFLQVRKDFLAKFRKNALSGKELPAPPRCMSWFKEVYNLILETSNVNSPIWCEKLLALTNKRSCGPPRDPEFINSKLEEFVLSVTTSRVEPEIDRYIHSKVVKDVQSNICPRNLSSAATVLVTNTSCYESSMEEGGKATLVAEIAKMEDIPLYDLETGEVVGIAQRTADKILHRSLQKKLEGYENLYKTRICVIPEIGLKVRIPTCSSFYRAQMLQPISKIFLEALKGHPELRAGLELDRQAFAFYKGMEKYTSYLNRRLLASDYKSSTDYIYRSIAGLFFDDMVEICGIPRWYANQAKEVFLHDLQHEGDLKSRFEVLKKDITISGGIMMGDPIAKAILCLGSLYVSKYLQRYDPEAYTALVGDDFISACTTRATEEALREAASHIGFVVSDNDTFESDSWSHFTEFSVRLPRNQYEGYIPSKFVGSFPPYADGIRPRMFLRNGDACNNTRKDPRVGRVKLLAQENAWSNSHESNCLMQLANIWQDMAYGLDVLPYVPMVFGGLGKRPTQVYLESLPEGKPKRLIYVLKHYTDNRAMGKPMLGLKSFLQPMVQKRVHLYNSHLGEERFVNLTPIIRMIEARKDLWPFLVISAQEQHQKGMNLSSRLQKENDHLVTSGKIAEKLYAFDRMMTTVYGVSTLNIPPGEVELSIPEEVWDQPYTVGYPDVSILNEDFDSFESLYLKEVLASLETSEITHPRVPLRVDINAEKVGPETDLNQYAKYVRALKGHTDESSAWMNIPRTLVDDDKMIKTINTLKVKEGQVPGVVTNDKGLQRQTEAQRGLTFSLTDLRDALRNMSAEQITAQLLSHGTSNAGAIPVDTANLQAMRLRKFRSNMLSTRQEEMVRKYLTDRTIGPLWENPNESQEDFFAKLRVHLGTSKSHLYGGDP